MTDDRRVDVLLAYTLAVAGEEEPSVALGPIHLVKYVYIADLAHAERHAGATYTGAPWRFHHYGPWALPVYHRIVPVAAEVRAVEEPFTYGDAEEERVRYRVHGVDPERFERDLPSEICSAVKKAVRTHGADTASLLQAVYLTAPMRHAAPEEMLDFTPEHVAETPAEPEPPAAPPSKRAVREHRERVRELRDRVREQLAARVASRRATVAPPRYDDVFAEGVAWLDGLAGEPLRTGDVALIVDESVWRSRGRREPTAS